MNKHPVIRISTKLFFAGVLSLLTPALTSPARADECTSADDALAGLRKLEEIKTAVTDLAVASGWVRPGYSLLLTVPGVNQFPGQAQDGDRILELFASTAPTGGGLAGSLAPNPFSQFRIFVRVLADGTVARDVYGRPVVERFEPTGRYYRFVHALKEFRDVARDAAKDPDTVKGMLASGAALLAFIFAPGTTVLAAVEGVIGWKGLEWIGGAMSEVRQQRQAVLNAAIASIKAAIEAGTSPTYGVAYQDYYAAMTAANLKSVLGPTDFFLELNQAGIFLE